MANSLKDLLNDALNISTGKSYKAEPARTVMRQASAPAQARTDNYVQNRPSQPARRRSLWSRAFDQVNPFDNNLTWKQETPTQNKSAFQQLGQLGGQTARGITTVVPQAINSTAELGGDTVDLARAGVAQATGNWKARDAALNRGLQSKYSNPGQGLLGTGGLIDNQTASKPIPTTKLVKTITGKGIQGAAEVGSAVTGGFAGKELVNQGFKQGFQSQVPNLVKSSVLNAAQGGADTFNRGGNSRDVVKAAATSALLGTAADVGLGVAGAATSKLVRAGVDNLPTKPVFADFNGKVPNDPIVNPNTGETLSQSIKKLEGYGWAEKDIDAYKNRVLGVKDNSPEIQPYKLKNNTVYHGTAQENVQPILRDGFKAGSELPESAFRGGGYGQMQDSISFSTDAKQASVFGAVSPRGSVIQAELKPNAKVVTVKGIDYAEDLNPRINELKKKGIDAVYLDGEKEVVVLDKNSVRATGKYKDFKAIDAKNTDFSELQPKKKLLNQDGFARLPGKDDPLEALKAEARKYKSAEEFVKAQGTRTGVEVRDKIGTKLQDPYTAEYLPTNSDGTITLYHSTTKEGAEKIKQSGIFGSKTEGGDIYFTTNKKGYGGIGKDKDVVLAFNVDPKKIKFDDVYRGELHLKGNNTDIGGIKPVVIKTKSQLTDLYNQATAPQVGKTDPMQQVFDANPVNEQATRLQRQSIDQPVKDTSYLSRMTNEDAARPAEFNAVAATAGSKSAKKLEQELVSNAKVTEKLKEAQLSGEEVNFYAKKDKNGRSVGIEEFDPTKHRIESGFVIDNNGKVLGNHVKVDSTGVQVNVGGDLVNMDAVVGNPTDWQGSYRMMETMDRNIKRNAPDEATYRRTREFLIDHKIKNEANFKEELRSQRQNLGQQAKDVQSVRPSNVSKDEFNSDIFDFIEGKTGSGDIKAKYGNGAQAIIDYKNSTRQLYDNLLDRVNEVFAKYGEAPVSKRKDYITHINELMNKPSFAGELFGQLQNTMLGEGMQTTRKSVPGSIAGRTETFEPRKRWNRFFQARKGGEFTKDPFKAVDAYLEPTLYNIHMTESAVRARAVETAFRTADEIRNMDKQRFTQALTEDFEKYRNGDNSKLITGFQEYANALAGKTQRFDRQIIDASKGTEMGLRGWQGLQRVGGRGTVLGNAQSVLSQTLNQPLTLADAGVKNYLKGVASSLTGNTPIDKSPFIRARATKVDSPFKGVGQKALDVGGVPLEQVELAMVKTTWNAEYHKAVEKGFKGQKAIMEADRATEQVVAGRGIADKPEAYRSTAANGFLQYTLEVAATNKKFWQDLSPTQKATYVAAVFGANSVFGLVTGYEPLPDFLGATVDTAQDFADPNDKRSAAQKAVGGAQRYASAGVEMNPLATAGVNTFLNKDQRQAIFGKDSSLGRFEGTAAPVQVVRNTVDAASKLTKKQYGAAASSAIKNAPYGNQVNKTATSAAMLARGYATDAKGNPTYAAPTSPIGKVQSLLFGPNSTKNAQNYYNNNQRPITGKSDLAAIKDSGNKQSTVAELQKTKLENRTKGNTSYEELKASLQNTFKGKFKGKTEAEIKDLAQTDQDAKTYYSQLQGLKNINNTPDLPDGIDAKARNVLTKRSRLAQEGKVKWGLKKADDKEITNTIHSWLPQTAEKPQITNDIAVKWAELEKKRANGTLGKLEEESQKKAILRDAYNSSLSEDEKDLYKLSKAKLSDALNSGLISEDNIKKALEVEKKLFDAGLIDKETLASKLGVSARGYKGKSSGKKGKSGKGRKGSTKGKYDYKLFAFNSKPSNTQKSLRELVKKATL